MNKYKKNLKSLLIKKYPNDDDDEIFFRFNKWLAELAQEYNLNANDTAELCEMFKNGASFYEIMRVAQEKQLQHQQKYEEACQKIADTMNGGRGSYHGHIGKNSHLKQNDSHGFEIGD